MSARLIAAVVHAEGAIAGPVDGRLERRQHSAAGRPQVCGGAVACLGYRAGGRDVVARCSLGGTTGKLLTQHRRRACSMAASVCSQGQQ